MDLAAEATRLSLDHLAVQISEVLTAAGLPHVLLKGPSTALWLYDPPRVYRDVDLLIPASSCDDVCRALRQADLVGAAAGRPGEQAPHSLLLMSTTGHEIDLHLSLPTLPLSGDEVWHVLRDHLEELDLGIGTVPVLDEPARCLVLALHALNNGPNSGQPDDDLLLARERCPNSVWQVAAALAESLDATDLYQAGLALVEPEPVEMSPRARLYATNAPHAAFGLERLYAAPRRELPGLIWRELFPTSAFMRYANPGLPHTRTAILRARLHRWHRLALEAPSALRAWRGSHNRPR